ncbi:hypothetical protein N9M96_00670 [Euryarchaeota archaeon]|nr:hypothetical protein [Euryarchaeota archaeon]
MSITLWTWLFVLESSIKGSQIVRLHFPGFLPPTPLLGGKKYKFVDTLSANPFLNGALLYICSELKRAVHGYIMAIVV